MSTKATRTVGAMCPRCEYEFEADAEDVLVTLDALLAAAKAAKATFHILKALDLGTFYVGECEQRYEQLRQAIKDAEEL